MPIPAGSFSANNQSVIAQGGTTSSLPNWAIHSFTSVGNTSFNVIKGTLGIEYVVVAGGGAGGWVQGADQSYRTGGGGGAGGYRSSVQGEPSGGNTSAETPFIPSPLSSYTISVGAGGSATVTVSSPGNDSSISGPNVSIVSIGGGSGGGSSRGSHLGTFGSAGGGGRQDQEIHARPQPTAGQGTLGGVGVNRSGFRTSGGGGGGAQFAGADGFTADNPDIDRGGNGGRGITTFIRNVSGETFAGGGGGGVATPNALSNNPPGVGGLGGGGNGSYNNNTPTAGAANTGGGGGGRSRANSTNQPGAVGGSGIVILRYRK
jgi:hypothetical protein